MIHSSVLSHRPDLGKTTYWHYDDVTKLAHLETKTNVGNMMERNQREFNEWNDYSRMGDLVKIGSMPLAKYFALQKQGIINDEDPRQRSFMRWLDANYRKYSKWFSAPRKVIL